MSKGIQKRSIAIIQARMGSTRLRAKSLGSIDGIPLIKRVVTNISQLGVADKIIVATSDLEEDDPLAIYCKEYLGCVVFRGSSKDVFSRFFQLARSLNDDDTILRITADNMFYQQEGCKEILNIHHANNNDYTGIKGLSHLVFEVLSVSVLRNNDFSKLTDYEREHVTPHFITNPETYKTQLVEPAEFKLQHNFDSKLTVDTAEDRIRMEKIIRDFKTKDIPFTKDNLYNWLKN